MAGHLENAWADEDPVSLTPGIFPEDAFFHKTLDQITGGLIPTCEPGLHRTDGYGGVNEQLIDQLRQQCGGLFLPDTRMKIIPQFQQPVGATDGVFRLGRYPGQEKLDPRRPFATPGGNRPKRCSSRRAPTSSALPTATPTDRIGLFRNSCW